jgi:PAS domain-containing protein
MEAGRWAVDALIRRLFCWRGVAGLAGLLALVLGLPWLMARRAPAHFELPLALVSLALMAAPTWSMRRARSRSIAGAAAELARKQAMFRDELEQRLLVQGRLRESEARLRAIIDSAPIMLFAIDRDGVITFSARRWAGRHPTSSSTTRRWLRAFAVRSRGPRDGPR